MEKIDEGQIGDTKILLYSEEPRYRMIFWGRTKKLYLPMPYVHYFIEDTRWGTTLTKIGMSDHDLRKDPKLSTACLPNMYGWFHCGNGQGHSPEEAVNTYWSGTFTSDGRMANHSVWRELAKRSGSHSRQKSAILHWWEENLDIDGILHMPWYQHADYNALLGSRV